MCRNRPTKNNQIKSNLRKEIFAMLPGGQFFTRTDEETLPEFETTFGMEKFGKKSV